MWSFRPSSLLFVAVVMAILAVGVLSYGLHFNVTPSLPTGIYRYTDDPIVLGRTVVTFCPPEEVTAYALERGYLHKGSCPGDVQPLGKYVIAEAGDTVMLQPDGITVNGRKVEDSAVYFRDSMGRELPHYPFGVRVIGRDSLWMFSGYHSRSFDSRYFGPVPRSSIISVARPIWVSE